MATSGMAVRGAGCVPCIRVVRGGTYSRAHAGTYCCADRAADGCASASADECACSRMRVTSRQKRNGRRCRYTDGK